MVMCQGQTTPEALSFNVRMCVRLAAPLAFFYLGWISENGYAYMMTYIHIYLIIY